MKTIKFLFAGISLLLFVNGFNTAQTEIKMKRQIEKNIQTTYTAKINLNYLLYLPKDYDSKDKWPLMIFLHGSGERGNDLELVKRNGPPKLVEEGKDFPFVIISPQCPNGTRWKTEPLIALLDEAVKDYKIDTNRIYITGLSM
ncbi:MAG: phospholipase, partial [Bacteroidetes bacterium]|nr:phospholipase [Bacteroidota bacterium]